MNFAPELVDRVSAMIAQADFILIGAGGEMSADAGMTYFEAVGVPCR